MRHSCFCTTSIPDHCMVCLYDRWRGISLANNRLLGPVGGFNWTALSSLQLLNLSGNLLSSSIPESWSAFRSRMSIDISNNNITGTLPAGLAAAGSDGLVLSLQLLNASNNHLTGITISKAIAYQAQQEFLHPPCMPEHLGRCALQSGIVV